MLTSFAMATSDAPLPVPPGLRDQLRRANISALSSRTGISRNTLTKMRDTGRARGETIAKVEQAFVIPAPPAPTVNTSKPLPLLFRRYAQLRSQLTEAQQMDVAQFEAQIFQDAAQYLSDPEERHEQAVLSAVRYIERRYLTNGSGDEISQK